MPRTEKTVAVRGVADFNRAITETRRYGQSFTALTREMERANMRAGRLQRTLNGFFRASAVVGSVYAMSRAFGLLTENAGRTEAALAGVSKTTEIVGADLDRLGERLLSASVKMGSARIEMLDVAKVAGQLGIHGARDLAQFTIAITKLAEATNLSAEEGATNLARFLFLTGNETSEIDRVASALVHLGNNVAARESEILRMATAIAQTTAALELNDNTINGWAATVAAAGLRVESTSNAIFRFIEGIQRAGSVGGKALRGLAEAMDLSVTRTQELINLDIDAFVRKLIPALATVDPQSVTNLLYALGIDDIRTHRSINTTIQQERSIGAFTRNIGLAESQGASAVALNAEFQRQRDTLLRDIEAINQRVGISMEQISSVIVSRMLPAYDTLADALEVLAVNIEGIISAISGVATVALFLFGGGVAGGARTLARAAFGRGKTANTALDRTFINRPRPEGGQVAFFKQERRFYEGESERLQKIAQDSGYSLAQRRAAAKSFEDAERLRLAAYSRLDTIKAGGSGIPGGRAVEIAAISKKAATQLGDEIEQGFKTTQVKTLTDAALRLVGIGTTAGILSGAYSRGEADILARRDQTAYRGGLDDQADYEVALKQYTRQTEAAGTSSEDLAKAVEELRMSMEQLNKETERQKESVAQAAARRFLSQNSNIPTTLPASLSGDNRPAARRIGQLIDDLSRENPVLGLLLKNAFDPEDALNTNAPLAYGRFDPNTGSFDEVSEALDNIAGDPGQSGAAGAATRLKEFEQALLEALHAAEEFDRIAGVGYSATESVNVRRARVLKSLEEDQVESQRKRLQIIKDEIAYGKDITKNEKQHIENRNRLLEISEEITKNSMTIEELSGFSVNSEQGRRRESLVIVNEGLALQRNHLAEINKELGEQITYEERLNKLWMERQDNLQPGELIALIQRANPTFGATRFGTNLRDLGNIDPATDPANNLRGRLDEINPYQGGYVVTSFGTYLRDIAKSTEETADDTDAISEHGQRMLQRLEQLNGALAQSIENPLQAFLIGKSVSEALGHALINLANVIIATAIVAPIVDAFGDLLNKIAAEILGIELDEAGKPVDINAAGATINIFGGKVQGGSGGGDSGGFFSQILSSLFGGSGGGSGGGSPAPINNQFSQIGSGSTAARGGIARRGGLALVGEQGAEIVRLPEGAEVYPAGSVPADMMGGNVNITNYYTINARDGDDIRQVLQEETPKMVDQAKAAIVRDAGRRTTRIAGSIRQAAAA